MILTKSHIYKFLTITLALSSLNTSAFAGRLSKSQTNFNSTEVVASVKAEVPTTTAAAAIKETEIKSSAKEEYDDTDDVDDAAEKNAVQPSADTSLSVWSIVRGLWNWLREDISESLFGDDNKTTAVGEGRTFGKIRRLQMALIPIVFKFGVLSAMVAFLVAVGLKTLFLVKVLIVMNLLALLAKFFTLKTHFGHNEPLAHPPAPVWKWSPYASNGWHSIPEEQHHGNKEIHLHIHGGQLQPQVSSYSHGYGSVGQSQGWERRSDPYSAYETMALQGQQSDLVPNELTNTVNSGAGSGQHFVGHFPENHRKF